MTAAPWIPGWKTILASSRNVIRSSTERSRLSSGRAKGIFRFRRKTRSRSWISSSRMSVRGLPKPKKDMNKEPSAIKKRFGDFAPKLVQLTDDVVFGDVWERADLSPRDRSLVTVA